MLQSMADNMIYSLSICFNIYFCGGPFLWRPLGTCPVCPVLNPALSFCSVSESTRHDAAAIAAHIDPVIGYVKAEHPGLDFINFWSDGPVTQYRNKLSTSSL